MLVDLGSERGIRLKGANLRGADLQGANLKNANLRGANLWTADLQGASLQGADLQGTSLIMTNFTGAKGLSEKQLSWAIGTKTKLPEGLNAPKSWEKSVEEQEETLWEQIFGSWAPLSHPPEY